MTRCWKQQGVTHGVRQGTICWGGEGMQTRIVNLVRTLCGIDLPNVSWRNTQRGTIDCMTCLVRTDA